jgi:hypothetical protein
MPRCKDCLEPVDLGMLRCELCDSMLHDEDLEWDENCENENEV